jgi:DNA-binding response OmpR family regulator
MATVLLVDDDRTLLSVLSMAFEDAGHRVLTAADGPSGLARAREDAPDAIVCDVVMPGLDGFSVCRRLREAGIAVPFVLLTSRDDELDEALGLELGADDYVAKPFSTRVLLLRVAALLKRDALRRGGAEPRRERHGDLELSPERLEVRLRETPVEVTVSEFRLLHALAERPGVVLSREQLLAHVRDDGSVVAERIIDTWVRKLRRKLEAVDPTFDAIETVVGAGYRLRDR